MPGHSRQTSSQSTTASIMTPTKTASVRQNGRTPMRRPSFRDDTNLVALRYEKTVAAEPPVPLPPRSPRRVRRPESSSSSVSSHHYSPIVVAPPASAVAPPAEEHPALRASSSSTSRTMDAEPWKRDSGHVPTGSPTTIYEEACEDGDANTKVETACLDDSLHARVNLSAAAVEQQLKACPSPVVDDRSSTCSQGLPVSRATTALGERCTSRCASPRASISSSSCSLNSAPQTLAGDVKPSRNLVKSFSLRSVTSMLSRRKSVSDESESASTCSATNEAAQERPPMPGPAPARKRGWSPPSLRSPKNHRPPPLPKSSTNSSKHSAHVWIQALKSPNPSLISSLSDYESDNSDKHSYLDTPFSPLVLSIPTDSLLDDDFISSLSFSNRGSVMFGGRRALKPEGAAESRAINDADNNSVSSRPAQDLQTRLNDTSSINDRGNTESNMNEQAPKPLPDIRVLAADVEKESQKVRSLYDVAAQAGGEGGERLSSCGCLEPCPEVPAEQEEYDASQARLAPHRHTARSGSSSSHHRDSSRRLNEVAGGLEDWEDVDGSNVDRYGFIKEPRPVSRLGTPTDSASAHYSPRKRNVLQKRDPPGLFTPGSRRPPSRKVSARSLNTQHSADVSINSFRSSRSALRHASNLLPHNRDRRQIDDAGDMLTISPSLQDIAEEAQVERISEALKRKEWERSEKWRKMAKVIRKGEQGQGMEFEFDVKNQKLIDRTWKGIPDRWRAAAWWSFLETSAKQRKDSPTPEAIVVDFHRLQEQSSPDDVQIDLDVPRTVSRHIMFRKRYRGGQRLLFRVLHAISIYFPETGYGQGMASLAATLLCYFDEEKCFVMMVRMWQLRGLDVLYRPQFEGLIAALKEFEARWMNKDVAKVLSELCVDVTSYGTKWYLTLFNLSVPFPAQLRIWDVFLLLGDGAFEHGVPDLEAAGVPVTGLDVLHATSAALIQGLREVLLGSDFENAMKSLTAFVPIKDEDILMKVMKAEWKAHQGRKKS